MPVVTFAQGFGTEKADRARAPPALDTFTDGLGKFAKKGSEAVQKLGKQAIEKAQKVMREASTQRELIESAKQDVQRAIDQIEEEKKSKKKPKRRAGGEATPTILNNDCEMLYCPGGI